MWSAAILATQVLKLLTGLPCIRGFSSQMPLVAERVSSRSLDFTNQRKAYMLRHVKKLSWEKIALQVVNVNGGTHLGSMSETRCRGWPRAPDDASCTTLGADGDLGR